MLNLLRFRVLSSTNKTYLNSQLNKICSARLCSDKVSEVPVENTDNAENTKKIGGFAKAYQKQSNSLAEKPSENEENVTFASLLKHSKFVDVNIPIHL